MHRHGFAALRTGSYCSHVPQAPGREERFSRYLLKRLDLSLLTQTYKALCIHTDLQSLFFKHRHAKPVQVYEVQSSSFRNGKKSSKQMNPARNIVSVCIH